MSIVNKDANYAIDAAKKADAGFKGFHEATIIEAILAKSKNGLEYLQPKIRSDRTGKEYSLNPIYTEQFKNGEIVPANTEGQVFAIVGLCNNNNPVVKVGKVVADVYDFDIKDVVTKPVIQITNILNKKIGVILHSTKKYKDKLVNGYTGNEVEKTDLNKENPLNVWIPDVSTLDSDKRIVINADLWVNPVSKLTFNEIQAGAKEPDRYNKTLKRIMDYNQSDLTIEDVDNIRLRKLKSNLSKANIEFDKDKFQSVVGLVDSEDVPY